MKGILHKWTNYVKGWQPRYFIIENGNLSYYRSPTEVSDGCNGIVNLSVCDLIVYNNDPYRFDLNIPGKLRYYLRANSREDRQKWIIAIGCEKAGGELGCENLKLLTSVKNDLQQKEIEMKVYQQVFSDQFKEILSKIDDDQKKESFGKSLESIRETSKSFMNSLNHILSSINQIFLEENPRKRTFDNGSSDDQLKGIDYTVEEMTDVPFTNETEEESFENIYFRSFINIKVDKSPSNYLTFCRKLTILLNTFEGNVDVDSGFLNQLANLRINLGQVLIKMQAALDDSNEADTLNRIIEYERERYSDIEKSPFTQGVLFFTRIMNFLGESLSMIFKGDEWNQYLNSDDTKKRDEDLSVLLTVAYSGTLRPFLSLEDRNNAKLILTQSPGRKNVIDCLLGKFKKDWSAANLKEISANAMEFSKILLQNSKKIDDILHGCNLQNKIYPLYNF